MYCCCCCCDCMLAKSAGLLILSEEPKSEGLVLPLLLYGFLTFRSKYSANISGLQKKSGAACTDTTPGDKYIWVGQPVSIS